ncbi:hypothetical protein BG004_006333 [Podila humilis]|nr:hypothetical protein BG004_006333 [Podila humilis]
MRLLLQLSLAALLVSSTLAGTPPSQSHSHLQDFLNDPIVQAAAPHFIEQIVTQGSNTVAGLDTGSIIDPTSGLLPQVKIPLLNDIVEIVTSTIFSPKDQADWGGLEKAKLRAIRDHGAQAVDAISNMSSLDVHRALLVVNTIYDSVIHLPATNRANFEGDGGDKKHPVSVWDYIGFGLIKSSDAVRNVRNVITPSGVCETMDTAYLKGVEEVVYYSSLTDGLAGGTLAASPPTSAVKSLGLFRVISAIGKLAIELHMAQSVAQLAELNPKEDRVRAMIYLALTAENPLVAPAQTAREINNLITRDLGAKIPEAALKTVMEQAASVLITRGAGHGDGSQGFLSSIPVINNIFAFSSDVLGARNVGDVLKFVFCPVPASSLVPETESKIAQPQPQDRKLQQAPNGNRSRPKDIAVEAAEEEADEDEIEIEDMDLNEGQEAEEAEQVAAQAQKQQKQQQQRVLQRPDPERDAANRVESQFRKSEGEL